MSAYMKAARAKGWARDALAERWGITPRRLSQIAKAPTQWDWDALAGLPVREPKKGG